MKDFFNKIAKAWRGNPNAIEASGYTSLQSAVAENNLAKVRKLLNQGAQVNLRGELVYPPLHLALELDRQHIAVVLIEAGADVNLPDGQGRTPLMKACMQGQEALLLTLLDAGADPNARDPDGKSALHLLSTAHPKMVDQLVARGAAVNAQDKDGETPLHAFLQSPPMVARFLENHADPNIKNVRGHSPYMMMLEEHMFEKYSKVLQQMLVYKADIGSTNQLGETILHLAARLEMPDAFERAVNSSALGARDAAGNNVLHALVRVLNDDMIQRVIDRAPALLREKNMEGRTPFAELVRRANRAPFHISEKYIRTAKRMLDGGADINDRDENGLTLLHHAVLQEKPVFVEYLLKRGANPDLSDYAGKAPLHVAIDAADVKTLDLLLDSGADPDLTDKRGWTVLDRLAEKGDRDSPIVQRLIVAGGQYQKQLPLHPEMMRRRRTVDKNTSGIGGIGASPASQKEHPAKDADKSPDRVWKP